jgi:hypothetical protein
MASIPGWLAAAGLICTVVERGGRDEQGRLGGSPESGEMLTAQRYADIHT